MAKKQYYLVDAEAITALVHALQGPDYMVKELQVTRNIPGDDLNPLKIVINQVNMQAVMPTEDRVKAMLALRPEYAEGKWVDARTAAVTLKLMTEAASVPLTRLEHLWVKGTSVFRSEDESITKRNGEERA